MKIAEDEPVVHQINDKKILGKEKHEDFDKREESDEKPLGQEEKADLSSPKID